MDRTQGGDADDGRALEPRSAELEMSSPAVRRKPSKRSLGWVQLNVQVPEDLRTQAKIKALQNNADLADVVTDLLRQWVEKD